MPSQRQHRDQKTDKTITQSNYTTGNNTGTVTLDASTMTTSNLSYSVSTVAKAYTYQNNVLTDSLEAPFNFTAPPSSSNISYRFVGGDSIYFDHGSVFMNGVTQASTLGGAKIKMEGAILYLTQLVHQIVSQNVSGVTIKTDESATMWLN
jgi:hypothetical protein